MLRALGLLLLSGLLLAPAFVPRPVRADCDPKDPICQQIKQNDQHKHDVEVQLQELQQSLVDTQEKERVAQELIKQLAVQIGQQKKAIAGTTVKLANTERDLRYTGADVTRREQQIAVKQQLLNQRARALTKHGELNYVEVLVTSRSFTDMVDRVAIMQQVVSSDQRQVQSLKVDREQVRRLEDQQQARREQQAALLKQEKDQKAELDKSLADQQSVLAYQQSLEGQYKQQQAEQSAENDRTAQRAKELQAQYAAELERQRQEAERQRQAGGQRAGNGGGGGNNGGGGGGNNGGGGAGRLGWPEQGYITQGFGCSDLLGEPYDPNCPSRHFHQGLDIGAAWGTPIGAADVGIVSDVVTGCSEGYWSCGGGYGNHIIITHAGGFTTYYAHLSSVDVGVGQHVNRGDVIGHEGSTGYSTGAHLHFGVLYNGSWVNPEAYLS